MKETNKNIEISTGSFFPTWAFALALVLIIGGVVAVVYQTLFLFQMKAYLFLSGSIIFSTIIWFSKKFFEFNLDTKQCRNGLKLFNFKLGEWKPLEIKHAYIAFQRYNENVHYTYGGLLNRNIPETVFELRLVYPDLTFKTLVNGRDFQSVAMMVQLGKILSLIYEVEFKDFVKGTVQKDQKRKQSNDNPLLLNEKQKRQY